MSGHSKWATIKRKKGAIDAARGKTFAKLSRQLDVATREGGGDPASNATLRTIIQKAKAAHMTNDAIDRAIKRGLGEQTGAAYETITYEGYAPGGVAMLVDALTNNRNRTAADVRMAFTKSGGALAEPGAVAWQFSRKGIVQVDKTVTEDDVMLIALDHGAEDVTNDGDSWRVTCDSATVFELKAALEEAGMNVVSAQNTMVSSMSVAVGDPDDAKAILKIMDDLEDNDDVQDVYSNFDISDELLNEVAQ
ncbi:MAG: YebC/PmpR family DNA-binding transcriptional regulator [Ilumatobacteraceae bacterium]|jgi:YebC/PmpR family DNA-binding regulatory protein